MSNATAEYQNPIVLMLLDAGEVVLGKVVGESNDSYKIDRPRFINLQQTQNGGMSMQLMPYPSPLINLFVIEESSAKEILKSKVIEIYYEDNIKRDLIDNYVTSTSGLEVAHSVPKPTGPRLIKG